MPEATNTTPSEGSYFLDAENAAEMARLVNQSRFITRCMEGLFPSKLDLSNTHDILDIACGPGGWVLDVAQAYPDKQVMGIDFSNLMINFAQYQAAASKASNVSFKVMNVLKPLDVSDNSFDFVNVRFISGFMPKNEWPQFLQECFRITRPGGTIRLTEFEATMSNSYAVEKFSILLAQAMQKAGQSFSPNGWQIGVTLMLRRFLLDAGCQHVQQSAFVLDSSMGTEEHRNQYQNAATYFKLSQPFLIKMAITTQEEVELLYKQALEEMMLPDYCALYYLLSAWGQKPQ
jgi:cyclopropane fatty-acyl-phospholipid synthase-like methyltransferase